MQIDILFNSDRAGNTSVVKKPGKRTKGRSLQDAKKFARIINQRKTNAKGMHDNKFGSSARNDISLNSDFNCI
jgi:hypothetical protein